MKQKALFLIGTTVALAAFSISSTFKTPEEFSQGTIQIGVVVEDLDTSLKFYKEVLGLTETGGFNVTSEVSKSTGLTNGIPLNVKVLKLKDEPDATEWKLMSFGKKARHKQQKFIDDDTGMQYITMLVTSIKPFVERLNANNIAMLGETPVKLPDGRMFILVQDPDGIFIEIIGGE